MPCGPYGSRTTGGPTGGHGGDIVKTYTLTLTDEQARAVKAVAREYKQTEEQYLMCRVHEAVGSAKVLKLRKAAAGAAR